MPPQVFTAPLHCVHHAVGGGQHAGHAGVLATRGAAAVVVYTMTCSGSAACPPPVCPLRHSAGL